MDENRISLAHREGEILWTMEGHISDELAAGILYGGCWIIEEHNLPYQFINVAQRYPRLGTAVRLFEEFYYRKGAFISKYEASEFVMRDNTLPGRYSFWLYTTTIDVHLVIVPNLEFLQGLFSILQAFNIPLTRVLASQIYHNGKFHNVDDLTLPHPNALWLGVD